MLLQGETFLRKGKKHLVVISIWIFFSPPLSSSLHFSPSLRSISKREKKTQTEASLLTGKPFPESRFAIDVWQTQAKNKLWKAGWRHRYTPPFTAPAVNEHRSTVFQLLGVCSARRWCVQGGAGLFGGLRGVCVFPKRVTWMVGLCRVGGVGCDFDQNWVVGFHLTSSFQYTQWGTILRQLQC